MFNKTEVITAMVTPFKEDLTIDFEGLEKLVDHLVMTGTDGILVAGTTGESPTLSYDEEHEILAVTKQAAGGRAKIIMGAGSNSTQTAIEASIRAEKAGVDGILSVVPYYNKPTQKGMLAHFSAIAKATDLPIILYNIPGRTVVNMLPETIVEIADKNPNIIAVKQSNGDLDQVTEIVSAAKEGFYVYCGDDSLTLPMLSLGAHGVISVASHIIGSEIKELITKFKSGDVKAALELQKKYYPVFKAIFTSPNPIPIKAVLEKQGVISDYVRLPLVSLTQEEKQVLFNAF